MRGTAGQDSRPNQLKASKSKIIHILQVNPTLYVKSKSVKPQAQLISCNTHLLSANSTLCNVISSIKSEAVMPPPNLDPPTLYFSTHSFHCLLAPHIKQIPIL